MTSADATNRRAQARLAIQRVAEERGLPTQLTILSERWNTVVELGDSGVIARAATLADLVRDDPVRTYIREVEVCRTLAIQGAPVQEPVGDVVVVDGLPVSLWGKVGGVMAGAPLEVMVATLAEVHRSGADITLDEPWFSLITEGTPASLEKLLERGQIDKPTATKLSDYFSRCLDRVIAADLPSGLIHGDAQRKNSMGTAETCVWIDWEDCCIGPYAWDIACLTMNPAYNDSLALDLYAEFSGLPRFPESALDTLKHLRDLDGLIWMLGIQDERDAAFRAEAATKLREVLALTTDP